MEYLGVLLLSSFLGGIVADDVNDFSLAAVEGSVGICFIRDIDSYPVADTELLHLVEGVELPT